MYGGYRSYPRRYGGAKPRIQQIVESLNAQMGTAYDTSETSPIFMENLAVAGCLADCWSAAEKMANQFIPEKMTDFLPRWEKIFGIVPPPGATAPARRQAVAAKFSMFGRTPTHQAVSDVVAEQMAPITTYVANDTIETADVGWPFTMGKVYGLGTNPPLLAVSGDPVGYELLRVKIIAGGTLGVATFQWSLDDGVTYSSTITTAASYAIPGSTLTLLFPAGTYSTDNVFFSRAHENDWYSSIAKASVQATKPASMSEAEYYARVGAAFAALDNYIPAWLQLSFSRDSAFGAGFYLDTPAALDNQRLSK